MTRRFRSLALRLAAAFAVVAAAAPVDAQVTTSAMRGRVVDSAAGTPLEGALIEAIHTPSGTRYAATTRADGRFTLPGMRVGGPYTVSATRIGFGKKTQEGIFLQLGIAADIEFNLTQVAVTLTGVNVTAEAGAFASTRTGAATSVKREQLEQLPTISRRIGDFTRLTPQANGSSFAGVDNRLNNITVDGAYFNNGFGLGGQPGDRTGVSPISLDAIEQVQVNIAPYDVRQGNFVGAGVNTVTKSGTNNFQGTLYYMARNESFVGTKAAGSEVDPGTFDYGLLGFTLGGPIVKDKLFFFASFEDDSNDFPATTFRANTGGETVGGNVTRVLESDLNQLSSFLQDNFGYSTGGYQGYPFATPSQRLLARLDYNLNDRNKFSLRYTQLESSTDVLASNSSSLGFGSRRTRTAALNFQNTNYAILENINSLVGEWNSTFGSNMSNQLIVGYTENDESRSVNTPLFPLVDILEDGQTYTSFGFEPFSPNNELRYNTFQIQNNFSMYFDRHDVTLGFSFERFESENVFFPGSQSAYVYNSLQDFYTDANDFLQNPNRTTSPVELRRFQVRWSNIPGLDKPIQPLEVNYMGLYAQDEWRATDNLRVTLGLRVDVPSFGATGFTNAEANALTFRDENGNAVQYQTQKLPDANLLWSPRLGVNWDVTGDGTTKIRGGTGVFTGRPAFVWISNQVGNNGVLTGFERLDNTTARPFNPDPNAYKPTTVTGDPASRYELALTDPDFKFPQVWRSNIAVDRKLPWGLTGTAEFLYSKDVNGIYYINANLSTPDAAFSGPDNRPRWTGSNRINANIDNAIVLKNQDVGEAWNIAFSLEKAFESGLFFKTAYTYGDSRNTVDAGSIAFGSWNNNPHTGNPNLPGVGFSANRLGHRFFAVGTYRKDFFGFGATGISMFFEGQTQGNLSWRFSGDINGDGGTSNDLIYIPRNTSEMRFQEYTSSGRTFTVAEQEAAWEAFIQQDDYLSDNRGSYAERNGALVPMLWRADLALTQDFTLRAAGKQNTLQFRLDIFNVLNMLNEDWGVAKQTRTTQPLIARGANAQGEAQYRLRNFGSVLLGEGEQASTFTNSAGLGDVWRMQAGIRYSFF